jgi:CRP/FNR family transcriptional regulator
MDELIHKMVTECLPDLGRSLLDEIATFGIVKNLPAKEFVVRQGQLIRYLPVVINGTVKVYSEEKGMQFLLYYIYPGATCIFSFANLFGKKQVEFSGITEEETLLLLIPVDKAREWLLKFPTFNEMILREYQKQYDDLLQTTKQITCYNLEERVLDYLKTKAQIQKNNSLIISHRDIAEDMATSREVISRLLKKMEKDKKILQQGRKIKIL